MNIQNKKANIIHYDFLKRKYKAQQTSLLHSSPQPEEYGIVLDENSYANVDEHINKLCNESS